MCNKMKNILCLGIEPRFLACKANVLTAIRTEIIDWGPPQTTDDIRRVVGDSQSECLLETNLGSYKSGLAESNHRQHDNL